MNERTRRPAPRTLSAQPPAMLRAPRAAAHVTRLPTLAALLAGGAAAAGCHDPECGATRAAELEAHGARVMPAAREGHAAEALREIGVALGVTAHATTRVQEPNAADGQVRAVTTTSPTIVPIVPETIPSGAEQPVSPLPMAVPHPPPTTPATVPSEPARGHVRRVTPAPRAPVGTSGSVTPSPGSLSRPRTTRA